MLKVLSHNEAAAAELEAVLAAAGRHQGADYPALFGASLAATAGFDHGLAVSSDSAAVSTLIGALGLQTGERVLVAAHLRPQFVFALLFEGIVPVFVDCLQEDLTLDHLAICAAMTNPMRAAFLAAPWGIAQDLQPIRAALASKGCRFVLDLTECLCTDLAQSRMAASVDVALLSLTEGESPLSTGEGGALLSNDAALMQAALSYQRFADLEGVLPGINQKISAMQAALGLHRLARLGQEKRDAADDLRGLPSLMTKETGTYIVLHNMDVWPEMPLHRLPQAHKLAYVADIAPQCPRLDWIAASFGAVPLFRPVTRHE